MDSGLNICVSNKYPSVAAAGSLRTTLQESLLTGLPIDFCFSLNGLSFRATISLKQTIMKVKKGNEGAGDHCPIFACD